MVKNQEKFIIPEIYLDFRSENVKKGHEYQKFPDAIAINIVDFNFPEDGSFHTCFHLREDSQPDVILTSALEIHFLNMVKWRKIRKKDISNPLHRWLVWFDEASSPKLIEEVIGMDDAIMSAEDQKLYFSHDANERDLYRRRLIATLDYNSGMNSARREGRAEVIALLKKGFTLEEIEKM